jgi:RNA polymerase sigma factor (sigma-70 family)
MSEASITLPRDIPWQGALRILGDDRLVRLAAAGNEHAFAAIFARHHQGLYRYCRSILGNDTDAQDALQNTMLSALRALPGERRRIVLKPWLYRIAHNEAISLLRRRPDDAPIEEVAEIADPREPGEPVRERLHALVSDLGELSERQRSAIVMRELSGLTYAEIGDALDSSPAAAKQTVYEAREALHRLAEGREMECEAARHSISANDRRILRGRRLRAHLRSCTNCRAFEHALRVRKADLAALAPPLPAVAAAALLQGIVGGGGGGGAGGGLIGLLTGAAGKSAAGSAAVKATAAAVTVAVGVGGYELAQRHGGSPDGNASPDGSPSKIVDSAGAAEAGGTSASSGSSDAGSNSQPNTADEGSAVSTGSGEIQSGGPGGTPSGAPDNSHTAAANGPSIDPAGQGGMPPGLGGAVRPGQWGTPPGHGGTPPGHAGTPPGQGGSPPGLGGEGPPGRAGVTPPGQGGTLPGQGGVPPGQAKKTTR